MKFETVDSGERVTFNCGMVRDVTTGKIHFHRVADGPMMRRWAQLLTRGAEKYPDVEPGKPNWTLAKGPEEYRRFKESAFRHFMQWYYGEGDLPAEGEEGVAVEDHAAAVFFNINGAEYTKGRIETESSP